MEVPSSGWQLIMKNPMAKHTSRAVALLLCLSANRLYAQSDFELENNWFQWVSVVTGQDEGIEQNLADNFSWMQTQGYTHLRFFGILPTGVHMFPSPTLDANGFATDPLFESVLAQLVAKADEYGIAINFDGWEVIAESNRDPTVLGVDFMTEDEVADVGFLRRGLLNTFCDPNCDPGGRRHPRDDRRRLVA